MAINGFNDTISWSQFNKRASRPAGQNEDAQIHPEVIPANINFKTKGKAVIITNADIDIELVSDDCWVVSSQMTSELLKHEQGHYDIIALSAREMYKNLLALSAASPHTLEQKLNGLKEKAQIKVKRVDKRYDDKTDHSRNKAIQEKWNKAIATEKQKPDGSIDNLP